MPLSDDFIGWYRRQLRGAARESSTLARVTQRLLARSNPRVQIAILSAHLRNPVFKEVPGWQDALQPPVWGSQDGLRAKQRCTKTVSGMRDLTKYADGPPIGPREAPSTRAFLACRRRVHLLLARSFDWAGLNRVIVLVMSATGITRFAAL